MKVKAISIAVGALLVIAALVAVAVSGVRYERLRAEENARESSVMAAREYAETMFGWTPVNIADHVDASMAVVTGEAKTQYEEQVIDGNVVQRANELQRYSEVEITDAGVVTNTRDTATVLIYMRQTIGEVGGDVIGPVRLSRLTYDMKLDGGEWKITAIDVIDDRTIAERLGIADDAVTDTAIPIPDAETPDPSDPESPTGG